MQYLYIDASLRNTNRPSSPEEEFDKFFRFRDGLGINNTSGFRPKSKLNHETNIENCAFCVLVTTFEELEWPDHLDLENGLFTYFGDKRSEGDLHKTRMGGNRYLKHMFEKLHTGDRDEIAPTLVFQKLKISGKSYMKFLGLAAPGARGHSAFEDLVAVWRVQDSTRFQNYRAKFTILKTRSIDREWLEDLVQGVGSSSRKAPVEWTKWIKTGIYEPLIAERKAQPRDQKSQKCLNKNEENVLSRIMSSLTDREFEYASVEIVNLMDSRFYDFEITQKVRDGGRDAIGKYKVGHLDHQINLTATIEAKMWKGDIEIGVKPMSRLISRLKHRDIGVFITTSQFSKQVQTEIIEDQHPVLLVSGGDIARILISNEMDTAAKLDEWLKMIKMKAGSDT
jgi:hypothetical protein